MNPLSQFSITQRLYLVSFVLVAAMAGVAIDAWIQFQHVINLASETQVSRVPQVKRMADIELARAAVGAGHEARGVHVHDGGNLPFPLRREVQAQRRGHGGPRLDVRHRQAPRLGGQHVQVAHRLPVNIANVKHGSR